MCRLALYAFCALICAPAFGAIITSEVTIGPSDPAVFYNVQPTGHLTVLDGATVNGLSVHGGRADIFGGAFTDRVWLDDRGTVVNVSGGRFEDFKVVNADTLLLNISGGVFTRGIFFDDSGWGGGTVTITGGTNVGFGFGGHGRITWTAHVHGGDVRNAAGIAGNSIHVYGYWLFNAATQEINDGRTFTIFRTHGILEDGTPFSWYASTDFNPDYPDLANIYTLHDLGQFPGDTNNDQRIDITDLNAVRNNFGSVGEGDADFDGDADIEDLNLVRNRFGFVDEQLSIAAVPEPASLVMVLLACTGLSSAAVLRHRRRHPSHSPLP